MCYQYWHSSPSTNVHQLQSRPGDSGWPMAHAQLNESINATQAHGHQTRHGLRQGSQTDFTQSIQVPAKTSSKVAFNPWLFLVSLLTQAPETKAPCNSRADGWWWHSPLRCQAQCC